MGSASFVATAAEQDFWQKIDEFEQSGLGPLYRSTELEDYLKQLVQELSPEPRPASLGVQRIYVARSLERNAFMFANGTIVITSGFLATCPDEAALAAVLGHEIGHFRGRHSWIHQTVDTGESTIDAATVSRELETRADDEAYARVRAAGYDLIAASQLFVMFGEVSRSTIPYAWTSHPYPEARRLRWLERVEAEPSNAGTTNADAYGRAIAELLIEHAALELERGSTQRARAALDRALEHVPDDARLHFQLGKLHRVTSPTGRTSEAAIAAWERSVDLDGTVAATHRALGLAYRAAGNDAGARASFERYLDLEPEAVDAAMIESYLREIPEASP